jgi:hypothetical protein
MLNYDDYQKPFNIGVKRGGELRHVAESNAAQHQDHSRR